MAAPRVFISSTYYDLRHVRDDIGDFIKALGYEPVMHDRGNVAYTQSEPLENSCYTELASCDIVVCIIGNKFGTKSTNSDLSITMEELKNAIKDRKKIYIYIYKDVFIENRSYLANKEKGFTPAYADNIKIHEFIADIKESINNHPIEAFETITDIIDNLRSQFAGLFQNSLTRDAAMTEAKTAYDLQETADNIKEIIQSFKNEKEEFFKKFDSTIFVTNLTLKVLRKKLGMEKSLFFAKDIESVEEFLAVIGFKKVETLPWENEYIYEKNDSSKKYHLELKSELFEEDGRLKDFRNSKEVEKYIVWQETEDDLPF